MKDQSTAQYVCTGVYATEAEALEIKSEQAMSFVKIFGRWPEPEKMIHRFALAHGLLEIPGYYGIDFRDREFIRVPDVEMVGPVDQSWPEMP